MTTVAAVRVKMIFGRGLAYLADVACTSLAAALWVRAIQGLFPQYRPHLLQPLCDDVLMRYGLLIFLKWPYVEGLLIVLLYVMVSNRYLSCTPGMLLYDLRFQARNKQRVGSTRMLVRHVLSYLSFCALLTGYIWAVFDPNTRTLHDIISGTYVIEANE